MPEISENIKKEANEIIQDRQSAYKFIVKTDKYYASKISSSDSYRILKWYEIYLSTNTTITQYFKTHKKQGVIKDIAIFEINIDKDILKKKIKQRTLDMIKNGLIDEVCNLEKKYTRAPKSMKSIGIKESLDYLDGKLSLKELPQIITLKTMQLAKRQSTFNKNQFKNIKRDNLQNIFEAISCLLQNN